jgi:hypothetical protein
MSQGPQTAPPESGLRWFRIVAVIVVALALAVGTWLILRDGGEDEPPAGDSGSEPGSRRARSSAVSLARLRALRQRTGYDIYWAGPRPGSTYELTRTTDGNTFIRYLPQGVAVGSPRPAYLTVGTYPRQGALRGLRRVARRRGSAALRVGGGLAVYSRDRPNSVYLAFPGEEVLVEVYDPSPTRARRLARSGRIRPVR